MALKGDTIDDLPRVTTAAELAGALIEVEVLSGPAASRVNKGATTEQLSDALGLRSANSAKSLLKEFRFFRAVDRDADSAGGACFETDIDYATCCALTRARIEFYRENDGEAFRQQDLECVYDSSPTPAGLAYVDGNFVGARNPSKFVKVAAGGGYTDEQINALLDAKLDTPIAASLPDIRQSIIDKEGALSAGVRYDITGNWNATGTDSTVCVVALDLNTLSPNGILRTADNKLSVVSSVVSVDIRARTTTPVASYAVQQQQGEQLARLSVQGQPIYGYTKASVPIGYASLDEMLADGVEKEFARFNAAFLTLNASNATDGTGWPSYVNSEGTVLYIGQQKRLYLAGDARQSLNFRGFRIFQAPNAFGGRVVLLSQAAVDTPVAKLPFLDGECRVVLELTGGAVCLSGYYARLDGAGTVYAIQPFQADTVVAGVNVIPVGGGGAGTVKSVFNVGPDAAGNVSPPVVDVYAVPQAVRDTVAGGTFANGELQGAQPDGSLQSQKFTTSLYGYEYQPGAAGALVWCRYPKG